jgi:RNA polymerase sporulation-specific sigma factor
MKKVNGLKNNQFHLCDYNDNDLLSLIRCGDINAENAIIKKYFGIAVHFSEIYYLPGGDVDDVIQEGLIGLMEAARKYDSRKNVSFATFAGLCVSRKIISAIRSAARIKHTPLNSYVPMEVFENESDVLTVNRYNPEEILISRERTDNIFNEIEKLLSYREKTVLYCFLRNMSYREIAVKLGSNEKSVDNAMSRSRRKLNSLL